MTKTIILLSALLAAPAFASHTIPVHNLSDSCFCKLSKSTRLIKCIKGSHPITVEFGTAAHHGKGRFIPTQPPTIAGPGDDIKAPISDVSAVVGGQGVVFTDTNDPGSTIIASLQDLQNPASLTVVDLDVSGMEHGTPLPLNSAWINSETCKFVGAPLTANLMALLKK